MSTWVIVGASRGIGLEFVRQLVDQGEYVYATVRDIAKASVLWSLAGAAPRANCQLLEVDVSSETSIVRFVKDIVASKNIHRIDSLVICAGILEYPNRANDLYVYPVFFVEFWLCVLSPFSSFEAYSKHLTTNAVGPIITAQKLIKTRIPIGTITFMSSDSGSMTNFREFEDGFAAYASSKAALNSMIRHMAEELKREKIYTTVLAIHPGEVQTYAILQKHSPFVMLTTSSDMANISVGWEVEGIISAEESVTGMLRVIKSKNFAETGSFWTWEGKPHPW
ncbi:hypothetical protein P7C71_g6164, partial [Lecanoromycetidae sp. Uapishka_2]